jgi:thiamine pyrophosphate-dependent acetolactate synthase large subunit-like protein
MPGTRIPSNAGWGSDFLAEMLRALDIPYVALNPGASYRGLHDSLVNHLGNQRPRMLLCLHEENAIAIAHGWAKVTDSPMLAIVHSNIGLMHGAMALFNAWCDRVPMLLLGATGPVDPVQRRPYVDWLHTSKDQAAMVRHFVKWDDQPPSLPAALLAIARAQQIACTPPFAPTYLCFDAALQEAPVEGAPPALPDLARYAPAVPHPAPELVERAARLLHAAERPAILVGRVSRAPEAWAARLRLAEALGARVFTDRRQACGFPSAHPLNVTIPFAAAGRHQAAALRAADVVLSLDWVDLAGMTKLAWGDEAPGARIIHASLDQTLANGWGYDTFGAAPTDIALLATPDATAIALADAVARLGARDRPAWAGWQPPDPRAAQPAADGAITTELLAATLRRLVAGRATTLVRTPLSWSEHFWPVADPLDYLGTDGGGGMGSAPGMAVGAALALRGSGRLPISMFGDGEFLMGASAIWTGAHERVPLLMIVANNGTYFNDELHQERVARQRGRPVENRWVGQRMSDPAIDLAMLARAQGATAFGPVERPEALEAALREAIAAVDGGALAFVDVRVATGDSGGARGAAV